MFDGPNNQYSATLFGTDRKGHTTPDPDASEPLRPYLPNSYPAPWLPGRRLETAHPVGAKTVISLGYVVGVDKSGGLVPAGMKSGNTGPGGDYQLLTYGNDEEFAYNPETGAIASPGDRVLIAAPAEAGTTLTSVTGTVNGGSLSTLVVAGANKDLVVVGTYVSVVGATGVRRVIARSGDNCTVDVAFAGAIGAGAAVTWGTPTIDGYTPDNSDITFAKSCDLIPGGCARALGYAIRTMWQYLGGTKVLSTSGGMSYTQNGVIPVRFQVHNYKHEMGNAIQTHFVLRMPWIGATPTTLAEIASSQSIAGYSQNDYCLSFVHAVGPKGAGNGKFFAGGAVVPASLYGAKETGHYAPYDKTKHDADHIIGRVLGFESMYPIRDKANTVRTQWERSESLVGPFREPHAVTGMMGGSATRGLDYAINLSTNGLLRKAIDQGKTVTEEMATYVYVHVRC